MGTFSYGVVAVELADDELALLEVVTQAMRWRGHGFLASFTSRAGEPQQSMWVQPHTAARFAYAEPTPLEDVDAWHLDLLLACADSEDGVLLQSR